MFQPVDSRVSFPKLEEDILRFWKERDIFRKSVEGRRVVRELGLKSKPEIEEFGIEEFNRSCRESVFRYVKEWEALTERIGFWVDMENAYVTYDNGYIESGW